MSKHSERWLKSCPKRATGNYSESIRSLRGGSDPHKDYLLVTDALGVKRNTARSIVATYIRKGHTHERSCGSCNKVKVDEEMNEIVDANNMLILSEINQGSPGILLAKPHDNTVGKTLDGMLIRIKLARPLPAD